MSKKRNTHTHTHTHTHTKLHSVRVAGVSPSCLLRMADFPLGEAFTFILEIACLGSCLRVLCREGKKKEK